VATTVLDNVTSTGCAASIFNIACELLRVCSDVAVAKVAGANRSWGDGLRDGRLDMFGP
jgi:hypothetical protein